MTTTATATSTEQEFKDAQHYIANAPQDGGDNSNENKLKFYAYFKQATSGPCTGKRPGMLDLVARYKYDAWKKLGNMSKEDAMKGYVNTLAGVSPKWRDWIKENKKEEEASSVTTNPTSASTTAALRPSVARRNPKKSVFAADCLQGQVAVITGGGSGICKAITEYLMRHGCDTVIISRTYDKLADAAQELEKKVNNGRKCIPVAADVRDYAKLEAAFDQVIKQFNKIDILVNGAAGNFLCPASKLSTNAYKTVIEIDTIGTFNASKLAYLKSMQNNGGCIINCSMTLHYYGQPLQVHAGSAKAAIDAMTKHLAVEWGLDGVRVNAIAIGPIDNTEGFARLLPKSELLKMKRGVPVQRFGEVEDIADACIYLASDAGSYVNGAILVVDGGSQYTYGGYGYPDVLSRL